MDFEEKPLPKRPFSLTEKAAIILFIVARGRGVLCGTGKRYRLSGPIFVRSVCSPPGILQNLWCGFITLFWPAAWKLFFNDAEFSEI